MDILEDIHGGVVPDNESFPEFFHSLNSHMILIPEDASQWHLMPPNQCDWVYSLTMLSPTIWSVYGVREDLDYRSEYKAVYKYKNGVWTAGRESYDSM